MAMWVFDIECLDPEDSGIILSLGACKFDGDFTYEQIYKDSLFVKFDLNEQRDMGRTSSQDTINWWKKQHVSAQNRSLFPDKANDLSVSAGFDCLEEFFKELKKEEPVWIRGSMDHNMMQHLAKRVGRKLPWGFNQIRDVRTAVDILYNTTNGYCDTSKEPPMMIAHSPEFDCIRDAYMLQYGIAK